jgi:hypothetical protein
LASASPLISPSLLFLTHVFSNLGKLWAGPASSLAEGLTAAAAANPRRLESNENRIANPAQIFRKPFSVALAARLAYNLTSKI